MGTWTTTGSSADFAQNWQYGSSAQGGGLIVGAASSEPSDFIGSNLNTVGFQVKNAQNPSPAVDTFCKVYNSAGSLVATSNAVTSDDLTTSEQTLTYTFPAPYHNIASGDRIVWWLPNNSSIPSSQDWYQYCNGSNGTAYATFTDSPLSFTNRTNLCPNFTITYGGSAPPSGGTRLPPPPAFVRI